MIYLDHSASTPLDPRVLQAMLPYFTEQYANSLAVHSPGRRAEAAVDDARRHVAACLNCAPREVIFTSGGTESDNLALRGVAQAASAEGRPFTLITGPLEHKAVSVTARQLQRTLDAALRLLPVDSHGLVDPDDLRAALHNLPADGIALVSLIHTHNEIGTINPIAELAAIAHEFGALFHTDAVQSPGHVPLDVDALGVDLLALSSHKFHGPKGSGVLILRDGVPFLTSASGAQHEDDRRAGTHNTPGIVGTAAALALAVDAMPRTLPQITALRDELIAGVLAAVPDAVLTGHPTRRHPGVASFAFKDIDANTLLMLLDQHGIAASSGSACQVGSARPSTVLAGLGLGAEWQLGGLRLSLGHANTQAEIARVLEVLPEAIARTRRLNQIGMVAS